MGKYGQAAVNAVKLLESGVVDNPKAGWELATIELFGKGSFAQLKGCPKGAFLGLCEEGLVNRIQPGTFTRSQKNKAYAVKAVELLRTNLSLKEDINQLWRLVIGGEDKSHNSQMDVVLSLWHEGLISVS